MSADFNYGLMRFVQSSPTPFHAVGNMEQRLKAAGFEGLDERQSWRIESGGRYWVSRNGSSIIAFKMPAVDAKPAFAMLGAHTDSPCLKIKPNPERVKQGYLQLGVEVYGGALLHPWFDRDLSLAGRVVVRCNGQLQTQLLDLQRPVAIIPSLAIHLDRAANTQHSVNAQTDLPPILGQHLGDAADLRHLLQMHLADQGSEVDQVLDYDLCLYDCQPPALVGMNNEFIAAARLDNLLSCYTGLDSLLANHETGSGQLLVCNDHEEIGSQTAEGAQGNLLLSLLQRLYPDTAKRQRMLAASIMISVDNAHGVHPNFADKHDDQHGPLLNQGPVIKLNANQRYATNAVTSSLIRQLAQQYQLPLQSFVMRSDMGCGSTIGPITAAQLGLRTLDMGVPTFAMHSIRELAGSADPWILQQLLRHFLAANLDIH